MFSMLNRFLNRTFGHPEALILLGILLFALFVLEIFGSVFAPLFVSIVLAYLLQSPVKYLRHVGVPLGVGVSIVFSSFVSVVTISMVWLLPLLWRQVSLLFNEIPTIVVKLQDLVVNVPPQMQPYFADVQWQQLSHDITFHLQQYGQALIKMSLAGIPGAIMLVVYVVLVPLLIFFMLKDQQKIKHWFTQFLPSNRPMLSSIWIESNHQVGNYVRGKFIEGLVVGMATFIAFILLDIKYSALLSVLVGVSVFIPYIGAAVVTIPVAAVALMQWGLTWDTTYFLIIYGVIQALDGNLLVPLLFSEAVSLHPIAIIIAILFFGAIWGMWGIFFAIPLASFINAIVQSWPEPLAKVT